MLEKFLSKPIELEINNKTITFSTIDDFEFSLNARTSISSDRVTGMISASFDELNDELKSICSAKFELDRLLSESPEKSTGINMRLKSLDTAIFSKENDWRDIFIALNGYDSINLSKHKNIALKMYLQYLKNRSNIANKIKNKLEIKKRLAQKGDDAQIETLMSISNNLSTIESHAETLRSESNLVQIPKAKSISLEIGNGDSIDIYLAEYQCKLISNNGIKFIDSDNIEHALELGENKIGRGKDCNVKLNEGMREISRLHLLIDNDGHKKIKLTDLSVQGTYLPKQISFK